jgi:hypothetical protein
MSPRLKSEIWVQALIRRAQSKGGFATVLRKGDVDAGIVLIILRQQKSLSLFTPERNFLGERVWLPVEGLDQAALDNKINKRVDYDIDIWVVEIESSASAAFLIGEAIERGSPDDPAKAAARALFRGK